MFYLFIFSTFKDRFSRIAIVMLVGLTVTLFNAGCTSTSRDDSQQLPGNISSSPVKKLKNSEQQLIPFFKSNKRLNAGKKVRGQTIQAFSTFFIFLNKIAMYFAIFANWYEQSQYCHDSLPKFGRAKAKASTSS